MNSRNQARPLLVHHQRFEPAKPNGGLLRSKEEPALERFVPCSGGQPPNRGVDLEVEKGTHRWLKLEPHRGKRGAFQCRRLNRLEDRKFQPRRPGQWGIFVFEQLGPGCEL